MTTVPVSGCSRPAITRRRVDLPPPLGRSSAVSEPEAVSRETSRRTGVRPKDLLTLRTSMAISGTALRAQQLGQQQRDDGHEGERGRRGERVALAEVLEAFLDE